MPTQKNMYICNVSGKMFDSEEQALKSEELFPRTTIWKTSTAERIAELVKEGSEHLQDLLKEIGEQNQSPFNPFVIEPESDGVKVLVRSYASTKAMPAQQGLMWESIHDLMMQFSSGGSVENFHLSLTAASCIIREIGEYFSATGKYAPVEESKAED